GYELWGANVFWVMAAMGVLAMFVKLDPQKGNVEEVGIEPQKQAN
ncbi:3-phenylpropionate MFS transporter, partial [Vibrio cyclitrophicus]